MRKQGSKKWAYNILFATFLLKTYVSLRTAKRLLCVLSFSDLDYHLESDINFRTKFIPSLRDKFYCSAKIVLPLIFAEPIYYIKTINEYHANRRFAGRCDVAGQQRPALLFAEGILNINLI